MRTSIPDNHFIVKDSFPDNVGIFGRSSDDDLDGLSVNDRKFLNIIENNVTVNSEGSIQMPLPLKDELATIPNNRRPVYNRQKNTIQQLKRDQNKLMESTKFMQKLIDSKHVEVVPDEELSDNKGRTWYLPVFPVIHPKKKKLRLVFDSAASYAGVSLNSFLLQGPDQNNKLRGVLLRFREDNIGFVADVASMFHCFSVNPEYRDFLRFFWPSGNDIQSKLITYRARVHIFGNTCSPSIATIGLRIAADSLLNETDNEYGINTKSLNYIHHNFYVDDGLGCASTVEEAINVLKKSKETLARYNIVLHKIVSNNPEVLNAFPNFDRGDTSIFHPDDDTVHRTLGVAWNTITDCFTIKVDLPDRSFTKRGILAVTGSIYDPIGLASPVVLGGRLIQRKILPRKNDHDYSLSKYG